MLAVRIVIFKFHVKFSTAYYQVVTHIYHQMYNQELMVCLHIAYIVCIPTCANAIIIFLCFWATMVPAATGHRGNILSHLTKEEFLLLQEIKSYSSFYQQIIVFLQDDIQYVPSHFYVTHINSYV